MASNDESGMAIIVQASKLDILKPNGTWSYGHISVARYCIYSTPPNVNIKISSSHAVLSHGSRLFVDFFSIYILIGSANHQLHERHVILFKSTLPLFHIFLGLIIGSFRVLYCEERRSIKYIKEITSGVLR